MSTPSRPPRRWRELSPWWLVLYYGFLLGMLFLFALFAERVYNARGFIFDDQVLTWFYGQQAPALDLAALVLNYATISYALGGILLVFTLLLWRRYRRSLVFLNLSLWGAVGINLVAKAFFERVRPDLFEQLTPITNSSFPSGHAMGSLALALGGVFVLEQHGGRYRHLWSVIIVVIALLVGVSRSYLQVHYPSDVLAAWALSTAWVMGVGGWYSHGFRADSVED